MIELAPKLAAPHYNLACSLARQDKKEEAFKALQQSVDLGQVDAAHFKADDDLTTLRSDPRFAAIVKQAEANDKKALAEAEKGEEIKGVRTVENDVEDGLRYRLRISPDASKEKPQRLIVWLHPSGGSMNSVVERLSPQLIQHGYALVVFTRKSFAGWSEDEIPKLDRTLKALAKIDGLDADRPLLLGFSAGGQMALILWRNGLQRWGGLVLDAAYPVDLTVSPPALVPPPKIAADAKQTPILVLVGTRDGGARVWQKAAAPYREAGIPLSIEYVSGLGHTGLFGPEQTRRLLSWLDDVSAGKLPTTTVGKPDAAKPPAAKPAEAKPAEAKPAEPSPADKKQ